MVFIGLLGMFENKELSGVNGATRGEVKGRRERERENYVIRNFITCSPRQILLGSWRQGGSGRGTKYVCGSLVMPARF
jgi:hypothetical protein